MENVYTFHVSIIIIIYEIGNGKVMSREMYTLISTNNRAGCNQCPIQSDKDLIFHHTFSFVATVE